MAAHGLAGPKNLITDVPGVRVGNASDSTMQTGVTVLTSDAPMVTSAHVMGGAPGTRETDLLTPEALVDGVDALVLSGGSAFGLAAADGVAEGLRMLGKGFQVGPHHVPIIPAAIIFDLMTGQQDWTTGPWRDLGRSALDAVGTDFAIGSVGAGAGATCANIKGGLGSASARIGDITVGALVAVNPVGTVCNRDGVFWAGGLEQGAEFGARGIAPVPTILPATKPEQRGTATVIAIVATDMMLTKPQAKRLSMMAHDGIARAVMPSHTPYDGDLVFAASTGRVATDAPDMALIQVGHAAAGCLARAIARGVHAATPAPGDTIPPWVKVFGP